jgi:hypothetical protein
MKFTKTGAFLLYIILYWAILPFAILNIACHILETDLDYSRISIYLLLLAIIDLVFIFVMTICSRVEMNIYFFRVTLFIYSSAILTLTILLSMSIDYSITGDIVFVYVMVMIVFTIVRGVCFSFQSIVVYRLYEYFQNMNIFEMEMF